MFRRLSFWAKWITSSRENPPTAPGRIQLFAIWRGDSSRFWSLSLHRSEIEIPFPSPKLETLSSCWEASGWSSKYRKIVKEAAHLLLVLLQLLQDIEKTHRGRSKSELRWSSSSSQLNEYPGIYLRVRWFCVRLWVMLPGTMQPESGATEMLLDYISHDY